MLKNIVTVLKGTAAAQLIGFAALPVLTRLFKPEDFGLYQAYQSSLGVLLVMAAMRFEIALLQSADGAEFKANVQLCALAHIASTALTALACAVLMWLPGSVSATTSQLLWYLPLGVLLGGVVQSLSYLSLRHKAFGPAAAAKVTQSTGYVAASVAAGAAGLQSAGLILGDLFGRIAHIAALARHKALFDATWLARPAWPELRRVARKFREFPLVSVPGGLVNAAGGTMTGVLMYSAFDASVSGQYGLAERSLMLPVGMVGAAVSQVYTADLSASLRQSTGNARQLFRRLVGRMLLWGLVPACLVTALAPLLFVQVFGAQWALAGEFARLLAPLLLVSLATGAVNMTIMILGWQKLQLVWELSRLVAVAATWLLVVQLSAEAPTAMAWHVAVGVAMNLAYLWLADRALRRYAAQGSSPAPTGGPSGH